MRRRVCIAFFTLVFCLALIAGSGCGSNTKGTTGTTLSPVEQALITSAKIGIQVAINNQCNKQKLTTEQCVASQAEVSAAWNVLVADVTNRGDVADDQRTAARAAIAKVLTKPPINLPLGLADIAVNEAGDLLVLAIKSHGGPKTN